MPARQPVSPKPTSRESSLLLALLLLGALSGLIQMTAPVRFGAGYEMVTLGQHLAATGSYGDPFVVLKTGPTAANPPAYPALLALLNLVLRKPYLVVLAAAIANAMFNALIAAWLPRLSLVFYGKMGPGVAASVLWILSAQLMPAWDASLTLLLLMVFCVLSARNAASTTMVGSAIAGLLAAVLFLLNPSTLLIVAPWFAYLVWTRRWPLRHGVVALGMMALLVLPWMVRNDIQLGALVMRTNFGMTIYASNNDCAEPSLSADESHGCYQAHHPNTSLDEATLLKQMGEVAYDHKRTADALAWISSHPARFRELSLHRLRNFWFPPDEGNGFQAAMIAVSTVLSLPGLILVFRDRQRVGYYAVAALLLYPGLYYVVVSGIRYRYPVLWITDLLAGYGLWRLWSWMREGRQQRAA